MKRKVWFWILAALNAAGLVCLIVFGVLYLTHDTAVRNPAAMIPMAGWESAGIALTVGFFPLSAVNFLAFLFFGKKRNSKLLRLLFLLPSVLCLGLAVHFWGFSLFSDAPGRNAVPVVRVLVAHTDTSRQQAVQLYDDGGLAELSAAYEPDTDASVLLFTWDNYTSELRDNRVENTLISFQGEDLQGRTVIADQTVRALLRALGSEVGHEIMEVKVFEAGQYVFAAVKTNVNWSDPCLFYQYRPESGALQLLYRWNRVDIVGISLPDQS